MKKLLFTIFTIISMIANSQVDCQNAIDYIEGEQSCTEMINASQFQITYRFSTQFGLTEVIFNDDVFVSNCFNLSKIYTLLDSNCNPIDSNNFGYFNGLIPEVIYYINIHVQCETGLIRTFCLIENGTLPIELYSIEGHQIGNEIFVKWVTLSERNVDKMVLEYSMDSNNWEEIGVKYSLGDSNLQRVYRIKNTPDSQVNYYRLITWNLDGSHEISDVIVVNFRVKEVITIGYDLLGRKIK